MKKLLSIILSFIAVLMIHCNSEAADIQKADLNIDGICLDQPIAEIFARYGQPAEVKHGTPNGRICIFKMNGGKLRVYATSTGKDGSVYGVHITGDTGLATKTGIRVGSTAEKVVDIYGGKVPDSNTEARNAGIEGAVRAIGYAAKLEHDYRYNPAYGYMDYGECFITLTFYLDENNKVIGISFWREYMDC